MLDAEIYVDRIADMRIKNMNTVLEPVHRMMLEEATSKENYLYLRTMEVVQI